MGVYCSNVRWESIWHGSWFAQPPANELPVLEGTFVSKKQKSSRSREHHQIQKLYLEGH